jgi:methionyl-tRNA synthetase
VHGYVTAEGRKTGKSAGNAIDPIALATEFGVDVLRYDLLRHIVLSVIEHYCDGIIPAPPEGLLEHGRLLRAAAGFSGVVAGHLRAFAFDRALDAIWAFVAQANRYVSGEEPWALAKQAAVTPGPGEGEFFAAKLHGRLVNLGAALQTLRKPLTVSSSERSSARAEVAIDPDRQAQWSEAGLEQVSRHSR